MRKILLFLFIFSACSAIVYSQKPDSIPTVNIIDHIYEAGNITISQPDSLLLMLQFQEQSINGEDPEKSQNSMKPKNYGFRIQIFSDNNAKTAKNEARIKSRNVGSHFPQYRTYVSYNSPYWRVKVGDFKTREEAESALQQMSKVFPAMKREMRIVKDRINFSN
ncbi:MAG: SPOR domain-containing protein [Paramuribaculum sp.]|nr:SPOR domain-containing protein [Paramuribaculum sp.]